MRAGAKEFLCKPLIQTDFVYAINKIYKNDVVGVMKKDDALVYSCISTDEHVGKTFFAFNLSKELADMSKENVLYIDFNNNLNDIYTIFCTIFCGFLPSRLHLILSIFVLFICS